MVIGSEYWTKSTNQELNFSKRSISLDFVNCSQHILWVVVSENNLQFINHSRPPGNYSLQKVKIWAPNDNHKFHRRFRNWIIAAIFGTCRIIMIDIWISMVLYLRVLYKVESNFYIYLFGKYSVHSCQASMVWHEGDGQQEILL